MAKKGSVPPGWYPSPEMAETRQYWDGERWTDQVAPGHRPVSTGVEVLGWIGAFLIPVVGFVIGAVMTFKRQARGGSMIVISLAVFAIWFGVIYESQHDPYVHEANCATAKMHGDPLPPGCDP